MNPTSHSGIVNVNESDFERAVLQASQERPVVVDFWAPWCGPCRALAPILEKLVGELQGTVLLAKVNIDESPNLAMQFRIQGIPLVIAFRQGKPVAEFEGVRQEPFVRNFLEKLLPGEADKLAAEAQRLEVSNPDQAELTYLQALDRDRQHESAALGLARLMIAKGRENEALQLLRDVPSSEEAQRLAAQAALKQLARPLADIQALRSRVEKQKGDAQSRYQLGVALAASGDFHSALEMLLSAAEADAKLASSTVREAMVNVFQLIGPQSDIANDYRNKLSALLY